MLFNKNKKTTMILALALMMVLTVFKPYIVTEAAYVPASEYHVSDEEWAKAKEELKKNNPDCTDEEIESMRSVYEYDQWSRLYGEQVKNIEGVQYLYNKGDKEPNTWFKNSRNKVKTDASDWVLSDENGRLYVDSWKQIEDKWYHFDKDGYMDVNWYKVDDNWYYSDSETGVMRENSWLLGEDHFWYYLKSDGSMATEWINDGGTWYFLDASGAMAIGWRQVGEKWYYLDVSGGMVIGWYQIGEKWYYFDTSGGMVTGSKSIGGRTYKFSESGEWDN